MKSCSAISLFAIATNAAWPTSASLANIRNPIQGDIDLLAETAYGSETISEPYSITEAESTTETDTTTADRTYLFTETISGSAYVFSVDVFEIDEIITATETLYESGTTSGTEITSDVTVVSPTHTSIEAETTSEHKITIDWIQTTIDDGSLFTTESASEAMTSSTFSDPDASYWTDHKEPTASLEPETAWIPLITGDSVKRPGSPLRRESHYSNTSLTSSSIPESTTPATISQSPTPSTSSPGSERSLPLEQVVKISLTDDSQPIFDPPHIPEFTDSILRFEFFAKNLVLAESSRSTPCRKLNNLAIEVKDVNPNVGNKTPYYTYNMDIWDNSTRIFYAEDSKPKSTCNSGSVFGINLIASEFDKVMGRAIGHPEPPTPSTSTASTDTNSATTTTDSVSPLQMSSSPTSGASRSLSQMWRLSLPFADAMLSFNGSRRVSQ